MAGLRKRQRLPTFNKTETLPGFSKLGRRAHASQSSRIRFYAQCGQGCRGANSKGQNESHSNVSSTSTQLRRRASASSCVFRMREFTSLLELGIGKSHVSGSDAQIPNPRIAD